MGAGFKSIELRVAKKRFATWAEFERETPEYSIGLEVIDDVPGHHGHRVHFDHHLGVVREASSSAAMQAYLAVRQGRLMERWLARQRPIYVYTWNADQDVCLAAFVLEYHELLERTDGMPLLRWIVQYNNKIDVCGGLYPVNLDELVANHFTWVFEPYRRQRMAGKSAGDEMLVHDTVRAVCDRLLDLLNGTASICPITTQPEILYASPYNFVIADEKGDPNSRLVLASKGITNLISLICRRASGRFTYSIIRASPYDEDLFPIPQLLEAFQAAEDRPGERIWGGSNMAAGSDSELGSSLQWTELRDIAERIVRQAADGHPADLVPIPAPWPQTRVLSVVDPPLDQRVEARLRRAGVDVVTVSSCEAAVAALHSLNGFAAVFSSYAAHERILHAADMRARNIPLVVCLPRGNGNSVGGIESGALVLVEPFSQEQVDAVIATLRPGRTGPAQPPRA